MQGERATAAIAARRFREAEQERAAPAEAVVAPKVVPQAIAAAALQMVYDRDCPNWMKGEWDVPEDSDSFNKPLIKGKKSSRSVHKTNYTKSKSMPRTKPQGKLRSGVIIEQ